MRKYLLAFMMALTMLFSCSVCVYAENAEEDYAYSETEEQGGSTGTVVIFAVVGFVAVGFITAGSMKAQLKSVRPATEARAYIKQGSFKVVKSRDIYLYKKIERREKPKQNQQ